MSGFVENDKIDYLITVNFIHNIKPDDLRTQYNNLKIISAYGRRNVKYADKVLTDNPFVFMKYFINTDYVVTDTFHQRISMTMKHVR